jgi:hypothetical protein
MDASLACQAATTVFDVVRGVGARWWGAGAVARIEVFQFPGVHVVVTVAMIPAARGHMLRYGFVT